MALKSLEHAPAANIKFISASKQTSSNDTRRATELKWAGSNRLNDRNESRQAAH